MGEGQGVGRNINLGNDGHTEAVGQAVEVAKLGFSIIAVACGKTGIGVALHTKGSISLVPVVAKKLLESVIAQVNMECVHLIVRQYLHIVTQHGHGEKLAAAVEHETTHGIVGPVAQATLGHTALMLLAELQEGTGGPVETFCTGRLDTHAVGYADGIALVAEFLVGSYLQHDVAVGRLACGHLQPTAREQRIIVCQLLCHTPQLRLLASVHDPARCGGCEEAFATLPVFQFGDGKRFVVGCHDRQR